MGKFNLNSDISFEDLDAAQLTKALSEHQNIVIKFVLIAGSFVFLVMMFNDHHTKARNIELQMYQTQSKLDAIKYRNEAIQSLKDFQAALPKNINEVELITLISDYAKGHHVKISSLSPTESRDMGLYDLINISFSAESDDFQSMMLFLRKIEKSTFPLRIDSWAGHEEENGKISFNVNINAVLIHQ